MRFRLVSQGSQELRSSAVVLNDKDPGTTPARELGAILANLPGRTDHERLSLAGGSRVARSSVVLPKGRHPSGGSGEAGPAEEALGRRPEASEGGRRP